jgi:hypothetical protein
VTAKSCFATAAKVREKVHASFVGLAQRTAEVMQCYRMKLQALADRWLHCRSSAISYGLYDPGVEGNLSN